MTAGRVRVNGVVATELGTKVDPARDVVMVDEHEVMLRDEATYLVLNKPCGYLTTMSDPYNRSTVAELVPTKMETPDSYDTGYKNAQKLEDALIGGEPMAQAAKKINAKFVALPAMNAMMKTSSGANVSDAVFDAKLAANAFALDQGIESQILETKSGFVILRVDLVEPSHLADFESVKKEVTEQWRKDEQKKQAYARANELLIKLNAGGALGGAKSVTVGRADGAPMEVLAAAFANPVGTKTIVPTGNAFYVLNVKKSIAPGVDSAKRMALGGEANAMITRMIADDYMSFLTRQYPIKINEKVYKRLIGE